MMTPALRRVADSYLSGLPALANERRFAVAHGLVAGGRRGSACSIVVLLLNHEPINGMRLMCNGHIEHERNQSTAKAVVVYSTNFTLSDDGGPSRERPLRCALRRAPVPAGG